MAPPLERSARSASRSYRPAPGLTRAARERASARRPGAPVSRAPDRARRPSVHGPERRVEPPDAGESRGPGLIIADEWPRERFSALVGLVVGINQFTFAFGPSLVGVMRDRAGTYGPALGACAALQAVAAAMILLGPGRRGAPRPGQRGGEISDSVQSPSRRSAAASR